MITRKELNLAIFEGTTDKVLWQPRLEMWIDHRRNTDTMPDRFKGLDNFGIYDELRSSPRYNVHSGLGSHRDEEFGRRTEEIDHQHVASILETPWGELRTVTKRVWEGEKVVNERIEEFPVSTVEDLRVLTKMTEMVQFKIDPKAFEDSEAAQGDRAASTVMLPSDGFTDLIKSWSGLLNASYLLADYPNEMDAFIDTCHARDDRWLAEIFKIPCRIFNLGDHTTNEFTPPPILERYCMPRWRKIGKLMTDHGRYVHSHWDGNSRHLLPYLKDSGLHAVEALTVEPMGDMTLEGIKAAVGDEIIVLDMIPVIYFLPNYPASDLLDFVKRVIDMFAPRLILGVSDELSAPCEIERIDMVADLIDKTCGLAV
ncbi:MAG: hypothetical protein ACYS8X_08720 [Planctomycetota bacterium]|jgi:hypothetical protein